MTVPNEIPRNDYIANGIVKKFSVTFDYETTDTLRIKLNGNEPPIDKYYIDDVDHSFNFYLPPSNGDIIYIYRETPLERDIDYDNNYNSFRPKTVNTDFDRVWRAIQEYISSIVVNSENLEKEVLDRIKADEDMLDYIMNQDNSLKKDYISRDASLKKYIDDMIALVTGDPSFNGVSTDFVFNKDGKSQEQINSELRHDSGITTWSGRTQREKNKDIKSLADFYKLGDSSMDLALDRAFLATKSLFIPSDEFIFLNDHIIDGDNLELWGDGLFVAKSLNFLKFTGNNIKINGISLEAFNSDSMINSKLLSVGGAKCKINDIKVFGNNRANVGVETTGSLNEIIGCELNSFYSYNGTTQAIRSYTANGSIIKGNTIWDLYSEKDTGNPATASSRAIYHGSTTTELKRTIISDNIISDIYGVEGDAIQILFNGGVAHLDTKTSVVNNTIDGFSRRAIKIQANNVKIKNNDIYSNDFKASQPNLNNAIDLQYSSGCVVTDNAVDVQDMGCIQVYGGDATNLPNARDNVVKDNVVKLRNPSNINGYAIYCERMYDSVIKDNEVYSKARGIGLGDSFNSSIKGNTLTGGHLTSVGISPTFSCGNLVIKNNDGLNFGCAQFIRSQAKESIVKDNYTKVGACVQAYADAAKSVYADNVNNNAEFTIYGTFTDQYIVNGGINMQGFNATPKIIFSDAEPATTFPNLRFNRGDRVHNRYPALTVGTPLTWVATANGIGSAANWVVEKVQS